MSSEPASIVFSLRSKLILALVGVVLVARFLAGSTFVLVRRREQAQPVLDHGIAASPALHPAVSAV